jgi:hypothetical protein
VDPGVKALGVDKHLSLLKLMSLLDHIDNLDWHTVPIFKVASDLSTRILATRGNVKK